MRGLGASTVFDYKSSTAVADIIEFLKGKEHVGALGIGSFYDHSAAFSECLDIVQKSQGKKFVACILAPPEAKPDGVDAKMIWGNSLKEVGNGLYRDFLPKALENGAYKAVPEALVVGSGLESMQMGLDKLKAGVSATKVVVTLD